MTQANEIQIADYPLTHLPETEEESHELGTHLCAGQISALHRLIEGSFQDVFHKPFEKSMLVDCDHVSIMGETDDENDTIELVSYKGRPFLKMGAINHEVVQEGEKTILRFTQEYEVL